MAKMWAGRTSGEVNQAADDFNSSFRFDSRMYAQDIQGSIAHAQMLAKQGIISREDAALLVDELKKISDELADGTLVMEEGPEDIHMFVEQVLTERLGEVGKKLHTARSRNDQVALDFRLYLLDESKVIQQLLKKLLLALTNKAEEYPEAIMPGYTHLQHAQPVLFSHHMMAYAMMFLRDLDRLQDCDKRTCVSPIGSCALAGTTYPTDRFFEAQQLGFTEVCRNSMDGVSDRDFAVEYLSCMATVMMHLSRFSEEIILWNSSEFRFIELSDDYTTGSSIMPQKKNPDMAELCRGKTGRVYGDLISLLTTLKGIPLAYNKDMQEDKEPVFDSLDTVKACLTVFTGMLEQMKVNEKQMHAAAQVGFMNATDLADYLVKKGMAFRDAYKVSGKIVAYCIAEDLTLETVPLDTYRGFCDKIEDDVYEAVDLFQCVNKRTSYGGTAVESVHEQLTYVKQWLSM